VKFKKLLIVIIFLVVLIFSLVFLSGCGGGKTGLVRGGCHGGPDATASEAYVCERMSAPQCVQNTPPCCFTG